VAARGWQQKMPTPRRIFTATLAAAYLAALAAAQNCGLHSACDACVNDASDLCDWCTSTNVCVKVGSNNCPIDDMCPDTLCCPESCNGYGTCAACATSACSWCPGSGTCAPLGTNGCSADPSNCGGNIPTPSAGGALSTGAIAGIGVGAAALLVGTMAALAARRRTWIWGANVGVDTASLLIIRLDDVEAAPRGAARQLTEDEVARMRGPDPSGIRAETTRVLRGIGYTFYQLFPIRNVDAPVRSPDDILLRLAALNAVCLYASALGADVPTAQVLGLASRADVARALMAKERAILSLPRAAAREQHAGGVGWYMENMTMLAWALGHAYPPRLEGSMITGEPLRRLLLTVAPTSDKELEAALSSDDPNGHMRPTRDIVQAEDTMLCAHNAARSLVLRHDPSFTVVRGGVIQEQRHALTWILSPGVEWDATDLST
jgi:hypothetical protein